MAIALPDPSFNSGPMFSIDGEAATFAEWSRRIVADANWEYPITPKPAARALSRRGEPAHSSADGVLAAIDACLDDYAVSDDAMRWAPDEPETTSFRSGDWYTWDSINERLALNPGRMTWDGGSVYTIIDETHNWDRRRTEEAAFTLAPWQSVWMESMLFQHGEGTTFAVWEAPQEPASATARVMAWEPPSLWSIFRSPQSLTETVFAALAPEQDKLDVSPALSAPVLPPTDGTLNVAISEDARRSLGAVRRLPIEDAPERYRRRRNRR